MCVYIYIYIYISFALQSFGRNCSPANGSALRKPTCPRVLPLGRSGVCSHTGTIMIRIVMIIMIALTVIALTIQIVLRIMIITGGHSESGQAAPHGKCLPGDGTRRILETLRGTTCPLNRNHLSNTTCPLKCSLNGEPHCLTLLV